MLLALFVTAGGGLALWKQASFRASAAEAANQPEWAEVVATVTASPREHRAWTTAIATVVALRSISLRNERSGTVRKVALSPGKIVEAGSVLVALDTSVEEAELAALQAEAQLADSQVKRQERLLASGATPHEVLERAEAARSVALARVAQTQAVIAQKTLRAPFRSRIGISDVHPGQFLDQGTLITTLQGADEAVYLDFAVPQHVAADLAPGDGVELPETALEARIVALDARVDPGTRNTTVRARVEGARARLAPGASLRVRVAAGAPVRALALPASTLRRDPDGDHVFVIANDEAGKTRARLRRVRTGAQVGDEVLIEEGLASGEQVAATGSFKLREGTLVTLAAAADDATKSHAKVEP
ncbi:MAG TPA: efflux RND transporter periplasmic adaptor subunit [Polyangiales bacterium]